MFVKHLIEKGETVLAVDVDINQHFAELLGLKGDNPKIADAKKMVKTTPLGRGSRLLSIEPGNEALRSMALDLTPERIYITEIMPGSTDGGYYDNDHVLELSLKASRAMG